jgi:ferrous iron transport protein B
VAVAALGTVYALSDVGGEPADQLLPVLAAQWSAATGFALLAWYVFAPQCLSTLAVIRRETNSVRTMAFAAGYLMGLAYIAAMLTYWIARALGA